MTSVCGERPPGCGRHDAPGEAHEEDRHQGHQPAGLRGESHDIRVRYVYVWTLPKELT